MTATDKPAGALRGEKAAKTANVQEWPSSTLPRCPFCNSSDIVTPIMRGTATVCQTCRARGPHKDRPTEAAAAWTSRAPDPVHVWLVAALEECAAEWKSPPCTVSEGAVYLFQEFARRAELARAALALAKKDS